MYSKLVKMAHESLDRIEQMLRGKSLDQDYWDKVMEMNWQMLIINKNTVISTKKTSEKNQ